MILLLNHDTGKRDSTARRPGARRSDTDRAIAAAVTMELLARREALERRNVVYGFIYKALAIESLPDCLRDNFLAMRQRIEADRPIADISGAE